MAITLSGIGSGLDIQTLVRQLVSAEGQAKTASLDRREANFQTELSSLGRLKSALSSLKDKAASLSNPDELLKLKAESADTAVFKATADSSAVAGTYSIEVVRLAQAEKLSSTGFSSPDEQIGSGLLTITSGENTFEVPIPDGSGSLSQIRDAINNKSENTSVSATIISVDNGVGGTESRLILTARETGLSNAITVTVDDDDTLDTDATGLSALAYDTGASIANMTELVAAKDSLIRIDTLDVTRSSNSISDAISGVTIDLASENEGTQISLSIAADQDQTRATIQSFVDSYNSLTSTYKSLTAYDEESKSAGALSGSYYARQIMNDVRSVLRSTTDSEAYASLFSVGIEIDRYGQMSIDSSKLDNVIASSPSSLTNLLSGDSGIIKSVETKLAAALDSGSSFETRSKSLTESLDLISRERTALDVRLTTLEKTLLDQFIAMDVLVAQYSATGNYLASQLASLPGFTTKAK